MLQINTILFPTDYSACAERAFSHAAYLAERYGAVLHVLHVIEGTGPGYLPEGPVITEEDVAVQTHTAIAKGPEAMPAPPEVRVVQAERYDASPASAILSYAKEHDVDLIVMGTHGRQGAGRLFSGSIAEGVLRRSTCPVFTVRDAAEAGANKAVRRILVPIDFSRHSDAALRYAQELADVYGARLHLMHVIEEAVLPLVYGIEPVSPASILVKRRLEQALRSMLDGETDTERVSVSVALGHVSDGIIAYAEAQDVDLIVMATHGRTGVAHLMLGSVAEKIVRMAPCPVFTVKSYGKSLFPEEREASVADLA